MKKLLALIILAAVATSAPAATVKKSTKPAATVTKKKLPTSNVRPEVKKPNKVERKATVSKKKTKR